MLIVVEGPHDEAAIVTGDARDIPKAVGLAGDSFMFVAGEGPELPTGEAVAVAQMEQGIDVIICDDVFLSSLAVKRKHYVGDFIAEKTVFEVAVEGTVGGVVLV